MTEQKLNYRVEVDYFDRRFNISQYFEELYCTEDDLLRILYQIRNIRQHEGLNYSPHTHDIQINIILLTEGRRDP